MDSANRAEVAIFFMIILHLFFVDEGYVGSDVKVGTRAPLHVMECECEVSHRGKQ
jgi:hypothetical protein